MKQPLCGGHRPRFCREMQILNDSKKSFWLLANGQRYELGKMLKLIRLML
jgi:hypothetical protein